MGMMITYGIGGYDETKPNNNVIEEVEIEDIETPDPQAEATVTVPLTAVTDLAEALDDPGVNSIAELKNALKDFTDKINS